MNPGIPVSGQPSRRIGSSACLLSTCLALVAAPKWRKEKPDAHQHEKRFRIARQAAGSWSECQAWWPRGGSGSRTSWSSSPHAAEPDSTEGLDASGSARHTQDTRKQWQQQPLSVFAVVLQ